jgi:hypothetical protein
MRKYRPSLCRRETVLELVEQPFNGLIINDKFCLSGSVADSELVAFSLAPVWPGAVTGGPRSRPDMNRGGAHAAQWQVRRRMQLAADGAWRWDRVYLLVLSWGTTIVSLPRWGGRVVKVDLFRPGIHVEDATSVHERVQE